MLHKDHRGLKLLYLFLPLCVHSLSFNAFICLSFCKFCNKNISTIVVVIIVIDLTKLSWCIRFSVYTDSSIILHLHSVCIRQLYTIQLSMHLISSFATEQNFGIYIWNSLKLGLKCSTSYSNKKKAETLCLWVVNIFKIDSNCSNVSLTQPKCASSCINNMMQKKSSTICKYIYERYFFLDLKAHCNRTSSELNAYVWI